MAAYTDHPYLVETAWLAEHIGDSDLRIVEVDVDTSAYDTGHIPGAIAWNWQTQLSDNVQRDILSRGAVENLLSQSGIKPETLIILYGDNNNWFASWAFWQLHIYGHTNVKLLNGGRKKWLLEERAVGLDVQVYPATSYKVSNPDYSVRALLPVVFQAISSGQFDLVDVRSGPEFTGEILAPPGLPETCQRGGHIPGARNIPWGLACEEDGTFKSPEELRALYRSKGIDGSKPVITYCRIGERSSHSWFVLKHILGLPVVQNYDGSWTEWGNLVGVPVELGPALERAA